MVINILINMVRDAKYSALKFMKFFVTTLIFEEIPLIREACLSEVVYFLGYLKSEDHNRVSEKLWDLFVEKIHTSKEQ